MLSFNTTYNNDATVTIPAFAENVLIFVAAGGAGNGGVDQDSTGGTGGTGGNGRSGQFTMSILSSRTLTFAIGRRGTNGPSNNTAGVPGQGGSGNWSGGNGGRSGPSGASGSGGGGGGATTVFDSLSNFWVIVAGGGGGGGGGSFPGVFGLNGGAGLGWGASGGSVATITNGGTGGSCPTDGGGGGGGGAGASGGAGGINGFDVSVGDRNSGGGGGGGSGYASQFVTWTGTSGNNSGNGFATLSYTVNEPAVVFSAAPLEIIRGGTVTLNWGVTGNVSSVNINSGVGAVATSGTRSVSPITTTQYTLTATGVGGTTTRSVTITVYQPPNVTLSLDSPTIIRGQSTTLNWVTTGDAGSASITPGIGAVNINGNRIVSPTVTTTYTINVSGLGGSDSDSITLIVYQPPTVNLTGPSSLNYGQQGTLSYTATNIDISLRVTPTYNYRGSSVTGAVVNLPLGTSVNGSIATQIPYNNNGPFSVTYVIVATGNGGQESKQLIISINIDETPTNFLIPESEELLKSQDPVITPDAVVTSYEILIDDIDIPVEVKADRPILVDINGQEVWIPIRSI